jgi:hypothetical protein
MASAHDPITVYDYDKLRAEIFKPASDSRQQSSHAIRAAELPKRTVRLEQEEQHNLDFKVGFPLMRLS